MDVEIILKTQDPDEARRFLDAIRPADSISNSVVNSEEEAAAAPQLGPTSAPTVSTEVSVSPGAAVVTEQDDFTAPPKPAQPPLKFAADPHITDKELMDACGAKVEALIAAGKKKAEAMAAIKAVIGKYVGEGASPSTMGQGGRNAFLRELAELA